MAVDLSKVQIPPEDADKPADIDNVSPGGDGEVSSNTDAGKKETKQPAADDAAGAPAGDGVPPASAEGKKEDKKEADAAGDKVEKPVEEQPAEVPPEQTALQKVEEEKHQLELDKATLEGKLEAMEKRGQITPETKKEIKSAAQIAEEAVVARYEGGWKPKDGLELNRIYAEELEKAMDAKAAAKEAQQKENNDKLDEKRDEIVKQVDAIYTEFKITDPKEQDKVANLASKWAKEGTANWSLNTLKLAAEHLQAKGEILKPATVDTNPKPTPTPAGNKADDKQDVNRKISRPTNEGGTTTTPPKKSISEMRRKTLDDIVFDNMGALG